MKCFFFCAGMCFLGYDCHRRPSSLEEVDRLCKQILRGLGGDDVETSRTHRARQALRECIAAAAGVDSVGAKLAGVRPADALLLLSGSHPLRRLPFARSFLLDSYDGLRLAVHMRDRGLLPENLGIWAVANPLTEANERGVERLRRKVELGAEVILTQPPLAWRPFERWLAWVHESGALELKTRESQEEPMTGTQSPGVLPSRSTRAKLLIGMPVITSPSGLRFWLELCGVAKRDDICSEAFESLSASVDAGNAVGSGPLGQASAEPKEGPIDEASTCATSPPYGDEWFRTTLGRLRGMGHLGVTGVHVMAPGSAPRRRLRELIEDGVFAPSRG